MVTVPRSPQRAPLSPLPALPGPTPAPVEAFGGGREAAGVTREAAGLLRDVQDIVTREQFRTRRTMLDDIEGDILGEYTRATVEQKKLLGENALESAPRFQEEFSKWWEGRRGEISDATIRGRGDQLFDRYSSRLFAVTETHAFTQKRGHALERYQNVKKKLHEASVKDFDKPEIVKQNTQRLQQITKQFAAAWGMSDEWTSNEDLKSSTAIHLDVIRQLSSQGMGAAAEEYFKQNRDQIDSESITYTNKLLTSGNRLQKLHQILDDVMAEQFEEWPEIDGEVQRLSAGFLDRGGALDKALKNPDVQKDSTLRKMVEDAIQVQYNRQAFEREERRRTVREAALDKFEHAEAEDVETLLWEQWDDLHPHDREAFRKMFVQRSKGAPTETNMQLWTKLQLTNAEELAKLSDNQVWALGRPNLNDRDFKEFVEMVAASREQVGQIGIENMEARLAASNKLVSREKLRMTVQRFQIVPLDVLPKDWDSDQVQDVQEFERMLNSRLQQEQFTKGRELFPSEWDDTAKKTAWEFMHFPVFVGTERRGIINVEADERREAYIPLNVVEERWGKKEPEQRFSTVDRVKNLIHGRALERGIQLNDTELKDKVERYFFHFLVGDIISAQMIVEGVGDDER